MFANLLRLYRCRGLVYGLVVRELKARYRGSFLGYFWSFLNPLLQLAVYTLVFTTFMPQRIPSVPRSTYALFLFTGLLPWTWFSSAIMESADVLIEHGNLIRKLLFPVEVLPLVRVVANMVHFILGVPILLLAFLVYQLLGLQPKPTWTILLFPLVVLLQLIMTTGFALALSALSVHFRDLKNIIANLLMMGFFGSAILFPFDMVQGAWAILLRINPLAHLMVAYQHVLYFGYPLGWRPTVAVAFVSFASFFVGYFIFDRLRDSFSDEV